MNDLISRRAAMSIPLMPKEHRKYPTFNLDDAYDEGWGDYQACVSQIPPAQQWVPCSERLPEDGRPVLIYAWNVHYVIARYDSFRTENGYKNTWVTADAWNGNTEIRHEVIAWMPLPEPYHSAEANCSAVPCKR